MIVFQYYPGFLFFLLCLTFWNTSQKVLITQKWFSYHLKADTKSFPTRGITLLYDNYSALSDQKRILVVFFYGHPLAMNFHMEFQVCISNKSEFARLRTAQWWFYYWSNIENFGFEWLWINQTQVGCSVFNNIGRTLVTF